MPVIMKIAPYTLVMVFAHEFTHDLHRDDFGVAQLGHKTPGLLSGWLTMVRQISSTQQ